MDYMNTRLQDILPMAEIEVIVAPDCETDDVRWGGV